MPTIDNWRALREALDAGPTGGRWRWEINMENKRLHLVGGPYREFDLTIMDFDRWGMSHAVATLRDPSVDGMNVMHRLPDRKDWIAPFPDRAHHANWCQQVTHPDMRWIQEASPKVIRSLLDERDRLAAEVEALRADAGRLNWLDGAIFVHRWNGVIDSGSRVNWSVAGDYRHTCNNMVGNDFRAAIDAAMKGKP